MEAIFSSKFYKDSKRKESIKAALSDPGNKGLVKQLRSYLDDSTLEQLESGKTEEVDVVDHESDDRDDDKIIPSEYTESRVDNHGHPSPSHSDSGFSLDDSQDSAPEEDLPDEKTDEQVEESIDIRNKKSIISSECLTTEISKELDSIKGLLDSRDDTAGTARLIVNEDELWVHYNDSINLNNVMEPVISLLSNAGYSYLQFNRLARTENAIVFMINKSSSESEIEEASE